MNVRWDLVDLGSWVVALVLVLYSGQLIVVHGSPLEGFTLLSVGLVLGFVVSPFAHRRAESASAPSPLRDEMSVEYWEFDYKGKRHHTVEIPVPKWWAVRKRFYRVRCKTFVCDDHGEVLCKAHGEVGEYNASKDIREFVHRVIKEGRFGA
jgi:hypothetical protein